MLQGCYCTLKFTKHTNKLLKGVYSPSEYESREKNGTRSGSDVFHWGNSHVTLFFIKATVGARLPLLCRVQQICCAVFYLDTDTVTHSTETPESPNCALPFICTIPPPTHVLCVLLPDAGVAGFVCVLLLSVLAVEECQACGRPRTPVVPAQRTTTNLRGCSHVSGRRIQRHRTR